MDIKLLNGKTTRLNLAASKRRRRNDESKSAFQAKIGQYLASRFPHDLIFEEVRIPGERFVLDFLMPAMRLVVECQGRQHGEYVHHFHKSRSGYIRHMDRDDRKRRWCELNGLRLLEILPEHDEADLDRMMVGDG